MKLGHINRLLVILGATSTGKTDLALSVAKKFNGELVSCDSRQVYRDLDIGTGKMPGKISNLEKQHGWWELNGIKIWVYDVVDPRKQYTVYHYVKDVNQVIEEIFKRGKLPIMVGGSGLYLRALLEGLPNLAIPLDPKLRKELEKLSLQELQEKLQKLSADKWEGMNSSDRQNPRRLIRAIEIASTGFTSEESLRASWVSNGDPSALRAGPVRGASKTLKIGLTVQREVLYKRIDERVISRINQGMIEEAERLYKQGLSFRRMRQLGLEYGVLADYLEGQINSKEELIRILQGKIHGFARRQITWFKKEKNVNWFDITQAGWNKAVERKISSWYYRK